MSIVCLHFLGNKYGNLVDCETGALWILPPQEIILSLSRYKQSCCTSGRRDKDFDWRFAISVGKLSSWADLIYSFCARASSVAVSGPFDCCDGFLVLFAKRSTYAVTLLSLVSLLYLLMSMTWCTPAVETGTSTIKVVIVAISSSVLTTLRADIGDHLGQSGSDFNHSGPWVHSIEHWSWAGVMPRVSKSATLSVVWQQPHTDVGNNERISFTRLATNSLSCLELNIQCSTIWLSLHSLTWSEH